MLLSDIIGKNICVEGRVRGVCLGVGVSLKTRLVKYLLCAEHNRQKPDFAVKLSAVTKIDEEITLPRLRAVLPQNCARIFIGLPLYSQNGGFLGNLQDAELENANLLRLISDKNESFSAVAITACGDAVLLRENLPFPLGLRLPAPFRKDRAEPVVTKAVLRAAIAEGSLVKLTLALPPFAANQEE